MKKLFTEHPASVGETYTEHLGQALKFSGTMALAAIVCFIHALLPFLFEKTGSRLVTRLYDQMVENRDRLTAKPKPLKSKPQNA